ncbi:MAG TPA: GNAT family N-acetyltransferase [Bauldia sp.]
MAAVVRDNTSRHRFELEIDDQVAKASYRLQGNVITFTHTEVPDSLEGGGVGSRLARGALEMVRAAGLKVVAKCPFIAGWIERHPDFKDLLAKDDHS